MNSNVPDEFDPGYTIQEICDFGNNKWEPGTINMGTFLGQPIAKWFKTDNNQIINLQDCRYFWIEEVDDITFKTFTKTLDDIEWNIGEYENIERAQILIEKIERLLNNL